jgi:hypothetical protein
MAGVTRRACDISTREEPVELPSAAAADHAHGIDPLPVKPAHAGKKGGTAIRGDTLAVPCRCILGSRTEETGVNPAGLSDGIDPNRQRVQRNAKSVLT